MMVAFNNGASAHEQTYLGQVCIDLFEQRRGQVSGRQQASKLQQLGGIENRLAREVDTQKLPQRLAGA